MRFLKVLIFFKFAQASTIHDKPSKSSGIKTIDGKGTRLTITNKTENPFSLKTTQKELQERKNLKLCFRAIQ